MPSAISSNDNDIPALISASDSSSNEENFTVFVVKDFGDTMMVLDNQSTVHLFRSRQLFKDALIVEAKHKCSVGGVVEGPSLKVHKEGIYDNQVVKYHPDAACNILSLSLLKKNGSHITFLEFDNVFLLLNAGSKVLHSFRACKAKGSQGQFYICDMKDRVTHVNHPTALNSLQSQRQSDVKACLKKEASVVSPQDGRYSLAGGAVRGGGIQLNRPAGGIKPTVTGPVCEPLAHHSDISVQSEGSVPENRGAQQQPAIPPSLRSVKTGQMFHPSPSIPSVSDLVSAKELLHRSGYQPAHPRFTPPKREELSDVLPDLLSDSEYDSDVSPSPASKHKRGLLQQVSLLTNGQIIDGVDQSDIARESALLSTVAQNKSFFSQRQLDQAIKAREYQQRMGFIPSTALIKTLQSGKNFDFDANDVKNADFIFGEDADMLKGNTVWRKALRGEKIKPPSVQPQDLHVSFDVMYIDGVPFLVAVTQPLKYMLVHPLSYSDPRNKPKSSESIYQGTLAILSTLTSRNFRPILLHWDGEGAISACKERLRLRGFQLLQVGAGGHVFDIERVIRWIKERFRALLSSLMFHLGRLLIVFGVLFIVRCLNFQVSSTSMNNMSPRQAVLGMATNGATAFRFQFASACTVSEGPSIPFFTVLNPPLSGGIRGVSDENRGAILSTVPVPPSQVVEDTVHPSLSISVQAPDINHATLGPSPPTGGRSLLENFRVGIENSSFVTADEYDKECKRQDGPYLGYLGMNFDFSILGVASVTMKGYIHDLFLSYGVEGGAKTPASDTLFHIRESGVPDNPIAPTVQAKDFHRQACYARMFNSSLFTIHKGY
jgi:hypothetical protein